MFLVTVTVPDPVIIPITGSFSLSDTAFTPATVPVYALVTLPGPAHFPINKMVPEAVPVSVPASITTFIVRVPVPGQIIVHFTVLVSVRLHLFLP